MAKFSTRDIVIIAKNKSMNRTYENLHIRVVASKTLSANPNQAVIEIYQLNQNSREELFNNVYDIKDNKAITKLECFLNDELLFKGQIINVNSVQNQSAAEWKTTIYCGNGVLAYREKINKIYPKGTTALEMLQDMGSILEDAGVATLGAINGITDCLKNRSIAKALTINGELMKNFKKILKQCFDDVDVHIDDDVVQTSINKALIPGNVEVINDGLIEPPSLSEQGINCKVTLNQSVKVGAAIQVITKSSNSAYANQTTYRPSRGRISGEGIFRVSQLKHTVDNFSSEVATTEIIGYNVGNI